MRSCFAVLVIVLGLSIACTEQSGIKTLVVPHRAYGGETIHVPISSNNPAAPDSVKAFDASTENVTIRLTHDSSGATVDVDPKFVIDGSMAKTSRSALARPGSSVAIAVVDLPVQYPGGFTFPATVTVTALRKPALTRLTALIFGTDPKIEILAAAGGVPSNYWPFNPDTDIEARPMLRLRAVAPPFLAGQAIGSLEFDLSYPIGVVTDLRAFTRAEAENAAVTLHDPGGGTARVVLVHPDPTGFSLSTPLFVGVDNPGGGPFIDITFEKSAAFAATDFSIKDLYVTAPDGSTLIDERGTADSTTSFELYARSYDAP